MRPVEVGDRAPDFTVTAHDGRRLSLAEFVGRQPLVIYFYPRSGTPVCTRQACAFRDAYEDFVEAGAAVIGVSGCPVERQRQFAAERRLPFLLVSDADGSLQKAFGVSKFLGIFPGRVTFVVDREGIVRHVSRSLFQAGRHVSEALAVVRELVGAAAG
ncbi:MAG TPA: peroxiredoxin [Pirellulales bacterium]|nr:peroxiredoxin [Pirellulales bacterium]